MPSTNQQHTPKGFKAYHPYARQAPPSQSQPYGRPNSIGYDSGRPASNTTSSAAGTVSKATSPEQGTVPYVGHAKERSPSDGQNSDRDNEFVPEGEGEGARDDSSSPNNSYAPLWDGGPVDLERVQGDLVEFKAFLLTAPALFVHNDIIRRFKLPNGEQISCVRWNEIFFVTGTDIVRCLTYRFHAFGRQIVNKKKFEEGIFSDLRNLKCNTDATLETPKSPFLHFLYKHQCVRTKKKQKVFFWYSVRHERLFIDALERDLKKEASGSDEGAERPTTRAVAEPALSFTYDPQYPLQDQIGYAVKLLPTPLAAVVDASMGKHLLDQSGAINCESPDQKLFQSKTVLVGAAFNGRERRPPHPVQPNDSDMRPAGAPSQNPRLHMVQNGSTTVPYSVGLSRAQQLVQAQVQAQVHAQLLEARAEGAEGAESVLEAAKAQHTGSGVTMSISTPQQPQPPKRLDQLLSQQAYSQQQQHMASQPLQPMPMYDRPPHPYSQYPGPGYNNVGYMAAPPYGPGYQGNFNMARNMMFGTPTRSFFEEPSSQYPYGMFPGYNVLPGYPPYAPYQPNASTASYPSNNHYSSLSGGVQGGGAGASAVPPNAAPSNRSSDGPKDSQRRPPASLKLELDELDINSDFPLDFLRREDIRLGNTPTLTHFPTEEQTEPAGRW